MFKIIKGIIKYINTSPSNKGQKVYRYFLAFCWQLYKRLVGLPLISKLDNGVLFILYPGSTNSTANIYVKTYEGEYIYFLREHLPKGGIVLDVGAHMGIYTLLLVDYFKSGYCFEPATDNFNALENNLFLNKLKNFYAEKLAVSDETKEVKFVTDGLYSGTNKIGDESDNTVTVQAVSIDDYVKEKNIIIDDITFVKMDTEGHEYSVLKGMANVLEQNKKMLILMESYDYKEVKEYFEGFGYKMFVIDKDGKIYTDSTTILKSGNYFAVASGNPLYKKLF